MTVSPTAIDFVATHPIGAPQNAATDAAIAEWQAHVDAGRICVRLPVDPAIAANRAATAAIFRAARLYRESQA